MEGVAVLEVGGDGEEGADVFEREEGAGGAGEAAQVAAEEDGEDLVALVDEFLGYVREGSLRFPGLRVSRYRCTCSTGTGTPLWTGSEWWRFHY